MRRIKFASTAVLLLLLGITAPVYAIQQQDQDKQQQDDKKQQDKDKKQQDQNRQEQQRVQQRQQDQIKERQRAQQQQAAWQQHRAQNWQSEHRTWQQRGGYNGYRIPDDRYRRYFGRDHRFRINNLPLVIVGGYPRFQYGGLWFSVVDPWPQYWSNNWYENDDVYVNYSGDCYYLYNPRYPRDRVAISVYVN